MSIREHGLKKTIKNVYYYQDLQYVRTAHREWKTSTLFLKST